MKRSAGILPYKIIDDEIYVYLEHPGGPYFKGIERYSICKGEYEKKEKAIDAAIREFKEESGFKLEKDKIFYLGSHKISNNKITTIFAINVDLDPDKMKSNTFKKEFSDGIKEFPEMDKARWFKLEDAKKYIFEEQIYFINKLGEKI